ncbi:MAG TPA: ATP-binding protein [Solirubrobacterales bacterium]
MDPLLNPFRPGAGTPPPILAGRQAELDAIANLLGRLAAGRGERSIVLTGLRGVGKTALLWAAEDNAEKQGWISQNIEARADIDFRAALADRSWVILRQLEHRGVVRKALTRLAAVIGRVRVQEAASGLEVSVDLEGAEPSEGALEADVVELFRTLGVTAREGGTGVLFLLDELQLADPAALAALCAAMQDVGRRELPLAVVAAGLPPLRGQLLAAKTYAERLFGYRELGPLTVEAATAALVEPARSVEPGLEFQLAALEPLLAECQGYPYFIQVYGHAAWQVASESPLEVDEAKKALALGRGELESDLYAGRWERASDRGRSYMRQMAHLGDGPVGSGEVAAALGGHSAIGPTRDRLIDEGLIFSPARGQVAFTVPGFANYVRQIPPSASS